MLTQVKRCAQAPIQSRHSKVLRAYNRPPRTFVPVAYAMVFVDMESVHFYEPPIKAAAIPKKSDSALITSIPTLVYDGNSGSDPVKIFDMSGSPLEEFVEPFFPWPLDSKCNVDVRGELFHLHYL